MADTKTGDTHGLTRREVLTGALRTAAGAALLPMIAERAGAAEDKWTVVGKTADFAKGKPTRVAVGNGVLYITRADDDTLSAVSAKCTHRGCEVGWAEADTQFQCPCHGAAFAVTGKNLHGTRRQPDQSLPALASVPVRQKEGSVEVNLGAVPMTDLQPSGN